MEFIAFPFAVLLWYLAYEAKPKREDEVGSIWEEETIIKRIKERSTIEKRDDDSEEIAIKRYETYEKNIKPVIDFYKQSNLLKVVNGESSIIEINNEISALIESIKG